MTSLETQITLLYVTHFPKKGITNGTVFQEIIICVCGTINAVTHNLTVA